MEQTPVSSHSPRRLYAVEFMRVFFIICILIYHVPAFRTDIRELLQSSGQEQRAVECFFIIAGFFLYMGLAQGCNDTWGAVKKVYLRLLPGYAFALSLAIAFGKAKLADLPCAIAQMNGIGPQRYNIIEYGDWFISVYFWASCLYIAIFQNKSGYRWLWTGLLVYLGLMLIMRNEVRPERLHKDILGVYFGIISGGFVRGITCMGLGMLSGFFAEKLAFTAKWHQKIFFTVLEVACLVCIYNWLWDIKHCRSGYAGMLIIMGALMISISHSWGYISTFLNKCSWVKYISRYTLPILFGQMVSASIVRHHNNFGWNANSHEWGIFVIGGVFCWELLSII